MKKDSALGKKTEVERDREQGREQIEGWQKSDMGAGMCVCVLCSAGQGVHGAALTAEPKRSLIWHVWCGPAPTIQPFVVPPHWAAWQWSAKRQWQRGPTIRMANLLMHPRADSLTFLFTTQHECERGRDEKAEKGEKAKRNKMLLFFQSSGGILPTQLLWFTRCLSPGFMVLQE